MSGPGSIESMLNSTNKRRPLSDHLSVSLGLSTGALGMAELAKAADQDASRSLYTLLLPEHSKIFEGGISKLRDELLAWEIFYDLREAKALIEGWRIRGNTNRIRTLLGNKTQAPVKALPSQFNAPCSILSAASKQLRRGQINVRRLFTIANAKAIKMNETSERDLDDPIDFMSPSKSAICLHEAGHAVAAIISGATVDYMELCDDPDSPGMARARIATNSEYQRKFVACSAFIVEWNLFEAEKLVNANGELLSEKDFLQTSLGGNAELDKRTFFGQALGKKNGSWPKEYDECYIEYAAKIRAKLPMDPVFTVARALLNQGRLEGKEVLSLVGYGHP